MQLALAIVPGCQLRLASGPRSPRPGSRPRSARFLVWILSAGTDESFVAACCGSEPTQVPDADVDGVLFVQLDGVSFPVMQWALQSGTMPTLRRWVDAGSTRAARVDRADALHDAGQPAGDPPGHRRTGSRRSAGTTASWAGSWSPTVPRTPRSSSPGPAPVTACSPTTGSRSPTCSPGTPPKASMTMSRLEVTPGLAPYPAGVRALPAPARRPVAQPLPHDRRDRPGAVPGGAAEAARGLPAGAPLVDVRRAAGLQQRPAARPQHGGGERGDDARCPQHLRGLRRLRRDRPPRRGHPDRVPGRRSAGLDQVLSVLEKVAPRSAPALPPRRCSATTASPRANPFAVEVRHSTSASSAGR